VDDLIEGIRSAMEYSGSPYEVINLGNNRTVSLLEMIHTLAESLETTPRIHRLPEQAGDVPQTWASIEKAERLLGYSPKTTFPQGIGQFIEWLHATSDTWQLSASA
ncbi:MAG: NAD-dependent epimerase/dehydratase family protein, partial [Bryobacteraceae bacterium]